MARKYIHIATFMFTIFHLGISIVEPNKIHEKTRCHNTERIALLEFKEGLVDPSNQLWSWVGDECCRWMGIGCDNKTGHIIKLELGNNGYCSDFGDCEGGLGGKISDSLLKLKHLNHLDLSWNNFSEISIPEFLGEFHNLRYLNLSYANFAGLVPPHLGNLTKLRYLDLSYNFGNWVSHLFWISPLSSLEYLGLSGINLENASAHWLQSINMLPSLLELHLNQCNLGNLSDSLPVLNFTSLSVFEFASNNFKTSFLPQWLFNLSNIVSLDLSENFFGEDVGYLIQRLSKCCSGNLKHLELQLCKLGGRLPNSLGLFSKLKFLDLSVNSISGPTPVSISNLSSLEFLYLSANKMSGFVPQNVVNLSKLRYLYFDSNFISGSIPTFIGNLSSLEFLYLSSNKMTGSIPQNIVNLRNLRDLDLASNSIFGSIPAHIGNMSSLEYLDMSHNQMNGSIPKSIGSLKKLIFLGLFGNSWEVNLTEDHFRELKKLKQLYVSSTSLSVSFNWAPPFSLQRLELGNCNIGPEFPIWLRSQTQLFSISLIRAGIMGTLPYWFPKLFPQIEHLDLSGNQLQGPILTHIFQENMPLLQELNLSASSLTGSIPTSLGEVTTLDTLDLSYNSLSGRIHENWNHMESLRYLDLSMNRLSGKVPNSIFLLPSLLVLKLNGNDLSGDLNCTVASGLCLAHLDLGENKLSGEIPNWNDPTTLQAMMVLRLRNNMFSGNIPQSLCSLSALHVLDLGNNRLSGSIPPCLGNMSGFRNVVWKGNVTYDGQDYHSPHNLSRFIAPMEIVWKGGEFTVTEQRVLVSETIDLSSNNFHGDIPAELANLLALNTLNLSHNQLTGNIPDKIGQLQQLESLDLSSNRLSGSIPTTMSSMTFLNYLNLSHNNLSGKIPSGNQFSTFNSSIYEGNSRLCGQPLKNICEETPHTMEEDQEDNHGEDKHEKLWLLTSIGAGYISGFWLVTITLITKDSWSQAYFQFLIKIKDWLIIAFHINMAHLRRKMEA